MRAAAPLPLRTARIEPTRDTEKGVERMATARKKTRQVLLIGGSLDGKWREQPMDAGPYIRVAKPATLSLEDFSIGASVQDKILPVPEYEEYWVDRIALYGEGIYVGIEKATLREAELNHYMGPEPRTVLILRAILQRDVVTEMGL